MKLKIGNGLVRHPGDIEAFNLYDDAAIDEARHEIEAKALRQYRRGAGTAGRGGNARAGRSQRRHTEPRHGR